MSLRPVELTEVVAELEAKLRGAVVQRAHSPSPGLLFLELRVPGRSVLLCVSVQPGLARLSVAGKRPPAPAQASSVQQVLRRELGGARLVRMVQPGGGRVVLLDFEKQGRRRVLHAELSGAGALVLADEEGRVLAAHASPERGLKPGAKYQPLTERVIPSAEPVTPSPVEGRPAPALTSRAPPFPRAERSRLSPIPSSPFPLSEAAESLLEGKDLARRADESRRALLAPLRSRLVRTRRTLVKVRAEASRQPEAERHRRLGELLSHNLHLVERGAREVRLIDYTPQGPIEQSVALDPAVAPRAQVERHFHQYRRLQRGSEHAARRVAELEAEEARLLGEVSRIEGLPPEALGSSGPPGAPPARKARPPAASPFREYRSAKGERILVGKSSSSNDVLTFSIAKPHDLWLHARGLPGSHVVIPLARGAAVPQELLLDAAHLALYHSDAKGESRGEVSYTQVKFVRRQKGGSPGQVTYTRERSVLVRIEPERLKRLIRSAEAPGPLPAPPAGR